MPSLFTYCFKKAEEAIEKELPIAEQEIVNLFEKKLVPLIEKKIDEYLKQNDINKIVAEIKE